MTVDPVEAVLHGPVRDQAALYGLLDRIPSLGLEPVEVRRLPEAPGDQEPTRLGRDHSPWAGQSMQIAATSLGAC
jgi:hypothetical protein